MLERIKPDKKAVEKQVRPNALWKTVSIHLFVLFCSIFNLTVTL